MKRKHVRLHHRPLLGALLMAAVLSGCGESDDLQAGQPSTGAGKQYVSLTFTMPAEEEGSRAGNPTGGENGDGHEMGQDYENTISTAVAFFFQNNRAGVNGDANTPVRYTYFDDFQEYTEENGNGIDRVYKTKPIPTDLYGEYNVLVVANPGTDNWWTTTTTLGEVRDKVLSQAWTESNRKYTNFLMSSAKDAVIEISEANNTVSTAANTTVDVERMAARVDYKKLSSYTCTDPNYTNATVKIEGAVLVNNLTQPGSYAMKRVSTATTGGTLNYLGNETLGTDGLPGNWVLDPTTNNKATQATFGVSWQDGNASDPNWWSGKATTGDPITKNNEQWNILGYTLENITAPDETKHDYNTAVVFKAKFHPATGSVKNYKDGATFFELGNKLYASMEDMMEDFSQRSISDMEEAIGNCASWQDVANFVNTLRDNDPCGYKLWLKNQINAAANWTDEVKESLTWTSYMLAECDYSATLANGEYSVTIDQNGKVTADVLAEYGARTYEDATCYYTWWIRHANDGDDKTNGVMEYAIVRNNIYELDVTDIYSLGGYIPNEEEHGFIVTVYVKDWTLLETEHIEM